MGGADRAAGVDVAADLDLFVIEHSQVKAQAFEVTTWQSQIRCTDTDALHDVAAASFAMAVLGETTLGDNLRCRDCAQPLHDNQPYASQKMLQRLQAH